MAIFAYFYHYLKKKFGGKWRFSAGAAGPTSKTKKYVCVIIKLNFCVYVITYPLTIKINPDNTVYANVSDLPLD